MIRGVHHVAIHTPNLDRLVAFYRDVVGFEVIESSRSAWDANPYIDRIIGLNGTAAKVVMMRAANLYVEVFEYQRPAARNTDRLLPSDYGYTHICFDVDDARAECERLAKNGMTFHGPPVEVGPGHVTIYGRDPDGNVIEIQQLPPAQEMSVAHLKGYAPLAAE